MGKVAAVPSERANNQSENRPLIGYTEKLGFPMYMVSMFLILLKISALKLWSGR